MAKAALRRRRGTKRSSGGLFSQSGLLRAIVGAMVLIGIGLVAGMILGTAYFSSASGGASASIDSTTASAGAAAAGALSAVKSNLRRALPAQQKASKPGLSPQNGDPIPEIDNLAAEERKSQYIAHQPAIGTQGAFPYFGELVAAGHDFTSFEAPGGSRFEEYKWGDSPYTYADGESDALARTRRFHVKKAMQHAWQGYETYAFGMDELKPISLTGSNNWGGMGNTLIDSLDTLYLMNMTEELTRATQWVATSLNHNVPRAVSVFETTIRSLGGLLAIYDWTQDELFLNHAQNLGNRLFHAFDGPTGIPTGQVNLQTGRSNNMGWTGYNTLVAECGTLQLEFRALARLTGNHDFKRKPERTFEILNDMNPPNGLYPYYISNDAKKVEPPHFGNQKITFGAMADSFYEYMLKIWLQGGKTEDMYREMYDKSIQGMHDELLQVSSPSGLVFIADKNSGRLDTKMDHLVCFMGGLLALGAYTDPQGLDSPRAQRDLKTGKALTYTCYQMYARMPTGISPEYIQFYEGKDFESGRGAPHYLLRPEALESMFILYHLTGDPIYREWGWEMFSAIERYCRAQGGYGSLKDVRKTFDGPNDSMESFFLAETLKYAYLLFDPETPIDLLNTHVFNTEAHPMRTFPAMDAAGVKNLL
mmetsp:Transcript_55295/g.83666  ORF Transcript_55295/g.83666 Transcript_55295/m.83666 type:complete len:648 (+) Transcript_55295:138-2081(+)